MVMPGFNTDFKYKGLIYHAQTEDNGVHNPVVVTLLYLKGAILASKKTSYGHLLGKGSYQESLLELMKGQHRSLMKEVLAGRFDESASAPAEAEVKKVKEAPKVVPPAAGPKSLDQAIMEFLNNFAAG